MHRHFATLFDRRYAEKGLALHTSLLRHSSEPFTLHILALDQITWKILYDMNLENVDLMYMEHFEYMMHMEPVKASRSQVEYFWTCASNLMEFLMPWTNDDGITYLDADTFVYSDPCVIFTEIGSRSIGIVPHRLNDHDRARLGSNGTFNVGVVVTKNSHAGRKCLSKWARQTREWCFNRHEDGKFGDQAYLNEFEGDYPGEVAVIKNLGVNLGPWSLGNFAVTKRGADVFINDDKLCIYHFHEFRDEQRLTYWPLRSEDRALIYAPYIEEWKAQGVKCADAEARISRAAEDLQLQIGRA